VSSDRSPAGFRRGVAAVVAAAALTTTACANGGEPDATQPDPATPTEETVAWADSACSALVPVVESVQAPPPVELSDPAATRQAYLDYFDAASRQAEQALQAVTEAGPPPMPGGEELVRNLRDQLGDLQDDLGDARAWLEATDPSDIPGVGEAIVAAGNVIGSLGNTAHAVAAISADPQLRPAFEQAQSCDELQLVTDRP
jgi:hypothetical protein